MFGENYLASHKGVFAIFVYSYFPKLLELLLYLFIFYHFFWSSIECWSSGYRMMEMVEVVVAVYPCLFGGLPD